MMSAQHNMTEDVDRVLSKASRKSGYRVEWIVYDSAYHYVAHTHEEVSAIDLYRAFSADRCVRVAKVVRLSDMKVIGEFHRWDRRTQSRHH